MGICLAAKDTFLLSICLFYLPEMAQSQNLNEHVLRLESAIYDDEGRDCFYRNDSSNFLVCTRTIYYDVSGESQTEITRSIRDNGPRGSLGLTRYSLMGGYDKDGHCIITLDFEIDMPNLRMTEFPDADFLNEWELMIEALTAHELNHVKLSTEIALNEFDSGCQDLHSLLNRLQTVNRVYDHETTHGMTEGVVVPQFLLR